MLTIRIMYKADGTESIWQALSLTAQTGDDVNPPVIEKLLFQEIGGADIEVGGDVNVYVMNDNGKTIAAYSLTGETNTAAGSEE